MPTEHSVPVAGDGAVAAVHHGADSDAWFVCCHGFRSDKTGSYEGRCRRAVAEGYDAVRFDFRGCGESDGEFVASTLSSRIADLRAVLEYFDPPSCVLYGSSFGGKVAFHAAVGDDRVAAIVARAPVTYGRTFEDLRSEVTGDGEYRYETGERIDGRFFEDLDGYDFADVEAELACPVAIFHGGRDESVDPADSFRAAESLDVDVLVERFAGEGHRFSRAAEGRMRDRAFHWLAGV